MTTDTDLVTVTIGGNDAGFLRMLIACSRAAPGRTVARCNDKGVAKRVSSVAAPLQRTFRAIRAKAPQAPVISLDYPRLFPASRAQQRCRALLPWAPAKQRVLNKAADDLDNAIRTAAAKTGIQFVDVADAFTGHEICTADPWVAPLNPRKLVESFHPNALGQRSCDAALVADIEHKLTTGAEKTPVGLPANPQPAP